MSNKTDASFQELIRVPNVYLKFFQLNCFGDVNESFKKIKSNKNGDLRLI